jgi:hypothetical protein
VHSAVIDVPHGAATSWRGSSDGGASWSATNTFTAPGRPGGYPHKFALWGDMATYNAGNSAPQILKDVLAGDAAHLVHFGDTAYDMYDGCGAVGDAYLNDPSVAAYSTAVPIVMTPGSACRCPRRRPRRRSRRPALSPSLPPRPPARPRARPREPEQRGGLL